MRTPALSEAHHAHIAALRSLAAVVDSEGLRIGDQYVMFFAEADLMRRHTTRLVHGIDRPDVLEVGLGLGVFAQQLARIPVGSYTAIEPHPGVALLTRAWLVDAFTAPAAVHIEPWQLVSLPTEAYDAIMYDTWPPDGLADSDFADFVEQVAIPCLRPGGRFSFFHSGDVLGTGRREVLDRHFAAWSAHPYTMPASQTPTHWTKPTLDFLIPIAVKGSA